MHYLPIGTFKIDVPKGHRSAAPDKVKGTGGVQPPRKRRKGGEEFAGIGLVEE
jgi:hypothetical protein